MMQQLEVVVQELLAAMEMVAELVVMVVMAQQVQLQVLL
jgi:hypothetical protein